MAREGIERRLAAILSADVVGYSRLMGEDDTGMLTAVKAPRRALFAPAVPGRRSIAVHRTHRDAEWCRNQPDASARTPPKFHQPYTDTVRPFD